MVKQRRGRKKNIALVLGAGGARGFAHVGVIDVLEKNGISPHLVVGTSMGALIGGIYAAGKLNEFKNTILNLTPRQIHKLFAPEPLHKVTIRMMLLFFSKVTEFHLAKEREVELFIREFIDHKSISKLDRDFIAIAADLISGKEVLMNRGSLFKAIRASIAYPGVLSSLRYGAWLLVDGGVVDHIPVRVAKKRARMTIAVSVYPGLQKLKSYRFKYRGLPNILQFMQRSLGMMEDTLINIGLEEADVVIQPNVNDIHLLEFNKAKQAIQAGERAAKKALPKLRALINYKNKV